MNIADIKSRASLALFLYLHLAQSEDVLLTLEDAKRLLGITSPTTWRDAKTELVDLGLVSAERRAHGIVFRLLATPDIQEVETLESRAYAIDEMSIEGDMRHAYSPFARRRNKLLKFLKDALLDLLPAVTFSQSQSIELVVAAEKNGTTGPAELLLSMIRRYSVVREGKEGDHVFRYLLSMVRTEGKSEPTISRPAPAPRQQAAPKKPAWLPPNQDFKTEEEAAEWRRNNPDVEHEALKKKLLAGQLKPKKRNWLEEEGDGDSV